MSIILLAPGHHRLARVYTCVAGHVTGHWHVHWSQAVYLNCGNHCGLTGMYDLTGIWQSTGAGTSDQPLLQPATSLQLLCYQPPTSLSLSVYVSVTLRTGMRQPLTRVSGHSSSSVQLYSCTVVHTHSTTPQCVQPQSVRGRVSGRRHQAATDYSSWISETILNISHTPILYWTNCSTSANLNNRSKHSTSAHLNIFSTSQLLLCLLGCLIEDNSFL